MSYPVLHFYATAPYPCSYLEGRVARSQVVTPTSAIDTRVYGELVRLGFRRSGAFTYRPYCDACNACVPVRVPVQAFVPSRGQRRCLKRNAGLAVLRREPAFDPEHFELYLRYQRARHPGGGMDNDSREQYEQFLLHSNIDTEVLEFRDGGVLRMVSLVDRLADGFSSVYTFFDPGIAGAGYGTYSVLWQIQHCREAGLPHVYLGYWIAGSRKMAYKATFRPIEALVAGTWKSLSQQ
jgi:leucyl-tRNA---protein transferase